MVLQDAHGKYDCSGTGTSFRDERNHRCDTGEWMALNDWDGAFPRGAHAGHVTAAACCTTAELTAVAATPEL